MENLKKKAAKYLMARCEEGIRIRLWMSVVMAVGALLVNVFYIKPEYDHLPKIVPLFFDMAGEIAQWGDKTLLYDYAEIRIAFFVIMVLIGWALCKSKNNSLLGKRQRLLVIDIANLVILTGVGMTLVYIEIAKGESSEKLSEEWEYLIMFVWLVVYIYEYISDKKLINENENVNVNENDNEK